MKDVGTKKLLAGIMAAFTLLATLPEFALKSVHAENAECVPESASVGDVLYENDFTSSNLSDWTTDGIGNGWQWNPNVGTVALEDSQDALRIQAAAGTRTVALPAHEATDYVYSATVKVLGDSGSFGLLTDVKNPAVEAVGAMHYGLYVNDSTNYGIFQYARVGNAYDNTVYNNQVRLLGDCVSAGDICTLTVYNIVGTTYFYINGKLISSCDANYFGTAGYDVVGIYACDTEILVTDVSIKEVKGITDSLTISNATVRYADEEGYTDGEKSVGLRFCASVDKTSELYKANVSGGAYDSSMEKVKFGALLLPTDLIPENEWLNKDTPMAIDVPMDKILAQTEDKLTFAISLLDIPEEQFDRQFTVRAYMKVKKGDTWEYTYAKQSKSRSFISVGNTYYEDIEDETVRARIDEIFAKSVGYYGKNASRITFSLLADFHYVENVYMSSVTDINSIIEEAHTSDADFVLHLGDFCNNYTGSPEIINAYVQNSFNMPVYGIYGNHELQGASDTMALVTSSLTNRKDEVVWGTADGKMGNGSVGYYYFDVNGIRVICLDTNYGWHKENQAWVHREKLTFAQTYGKGAVIDENAFGAQQRSWLKKVLNDAAERNISCILASHHDTSGMRVQPPADAAEVREILKQANEKRAGTVLMVMNGHLHTDAFHVVDDILYFDVNTVRNGSWDDEGVKHYSEDLTFEKISYDEEGEETGRGPMFINKLSESDTTYFYTDPLHTFVTVSSSGRIEIEGMETTWLAGLDPQRNSPYKHPWISSGVFDMPVD